jgi:signal transduction histidine kinase
LALARSPTAASWDAVRGDPGAVLLLVRHSPMLRATSSGSLVPGSLANPALLEDALRRLDPPIAGWVDWNHPSIQAIHQSALRYASTAQALAELDKSCDPDLAWIGGLLAPLGWFAVAAVDAAAAGACFHDPAFPRDPRTAQVRHWGMTAAAIGRRLSLRWRLPDWLSAIVGHLRLSVETAARFGAEPNLFRVVQCAVAHVEKQGIADCRLQIADCRPETAQPAFAICNLQSAICNTVTGQNPADVPLLKDLLQLSARNLRLQGAPALERLENDFDDLHAALEEHRTAESERLREQKLRALAEFAAGAGHEINNPLAVISGQAQYLLKQLQVVDFGFEGEESSGSPLEEVVAEQIYNLQTAISNSQKTIIAQAQRIHQILRDLMQFARPPQPVKQVVDLNVLVRDTANSTADFAAERQVRLQCTESTAPLLIEVDPGQICTALSCLLRNAVEAAPSQPEGTGWAGIRVSADHVDRVAVIIEDNGSGPAALEREHLFDPFFSGRPAGRGRGLGLPTAWRLANQHGGEVTFSRGPDGPTQFTLSLPRFIEPTTALDSSVAA